MQRHGSADGSGCCRDQLYFANISLCIFDEALSGFYLDGKFLEPRSDDTLAKLASNLEKQRAGSILRTVEAQLLYVGSDMHEAYSLKKAELRASPASSSSAPQAQQLVLALKRLMDDSPQACSDSRWLRAACALLAAAGLGMPAARPALG